jgi:hypothetical protein
MKVIRFYIYGGITKFWGQSIKVMSSIICLNQKKIKRINAHLQPLNQASDGDETMR